MGTELAERSDCFIHINLDCTNPLTLHPVPICQATEILYICGRTEDKVVKMTNFGL